MTRIPVNPELIRWAVDRSGISFSDLNERFPHLSAWQTGDTQPTYKQLESFAHATMAPFGTFFLDQPPIEELPLPDFRTLGDSPLRRFSPNLLETIHAVQQRQAWLREWLLEEGAEPLEFVGSATLSVNYKQLAGRIRQRLELQTNWADSLPSWESALQTLRIAVENVGVSVFSNSTVGLNSHRRLDPAEFRGFVICDAVAPVVFLNDADTKSARIFTLAHEIVHLWVGQDAIFNLERLLPADAQVERLCNQVAAELLVPESRLRSHWSSVNGTKEPFTALAHVFKVSPVVAARRTLDLGLISKAEFFKFYEADQAAWHARQGSDLKAKAGGNFYATQAKRLGNRFSNAIVRAVREGRATYQDAFRLTGMRSEVFIEYSHQVLKRVKGESE